VFEQLNGAVIRPTGRGDPASLDAEKDCPASPEWATRSWRTGKVPVFLGSTYRSQATYKRPPLPAARLDPLTNCPRCFFVSKNGSLTTVLGLVQVWPRSDDDDTTIRVPIRSGQG